MSNKTISLAIIDDHQVVVDGLKAMLAGSNDLEVVFTTTSAEELIKFVKTNPVDVILMDIQMPGMSGIDLCKAVIKENYSCKVIAFSSFDDTFYVHSIVRNGASGYILKNAPKEVVEKAVRTVAEGGEFIDDNIKKQLLQEAASGQKRPVNEIPLTKREKEILKLVVDEHTNQEIADKLFISLRTVESHRLNLTQKLGVKNAAGLIKEAIKRGLVK
jgi:DNA-binding NarL/FixJ family response regulator